MTPEQVQAIADLRARDVSPKQIARQLGLRPAEVSAVIKAQAEQVAAQRAASGEVNPLHHCLVNCNCLDSLLPDNLRSEFGLEAETQIDQDPDSGIAVVTVTRKAGFNRLETATFLVDIWCLGVKDTSPPRKLDPSTYKDFIDFAYQAFPDSYQEIPLPLAQAIVLGGVNYAADLGFQPHKDFEKARELLGEWDGQPQLNFGKDGKPYYMNGPYDDTLKILRTLREKVGEENFDYAIGSDQEW